MVGDPASVPMTPLALLPKHATAPVVRSMHVNRLLAEIPAAFVTGVLEPALVITGTPMVSPLVLEAVPSSPSMLEPQQYAPPEDVTAHEWKEPADTDTAFDSVACEPPTDAITVCGEFWLVVLKLPT